MSAPSTFRSLASLLRDDGGCLESPANEDEAIECSADLADAIDAQSSLADLLREMRLFHARLNELLEQSVAALRADIASDVLARELQTSPADVAAIAKRLAARFMDEHPVRIRVHPDEAHLVDCGIPIAGDRGLHRGDAVLELRNGIVDASLGVRLQGVLEACT